MNFFPSRVDDLGAIDETSRVAERLLTPVTVIAPNGSIRYLNREMARLLECEPERLKGRKLLDYVHPGDRERVARELSCVAAVEGVGGNSSFRVRGHDAQGWRVFDAYAHNLSDDPSARGIVISGADVTERERLARTLTSLSDVTRILMHAQDERTLMKEVCDSIVETGDYLVAWVGYAEHDEAKSVRLVASGGETECLRTDRTTWSDDQLGRGPTGAAIRTETIQVVRDPQRSTRYRAWRDQMDRFGVRSVCSLPLVVGECIGALTIYSRDAECFGPGEIEVLSKYANELSFGIKRLRDLQSLVRSERQLRAAERLAHVGHWEWELASDHIKFNADEIYGLNRESWLATMDSFLASVPHDERADVRAALDETIVTGSVELTHRIITPCGDERFLRVRAEVVNGDDGRPERVLGTSLDITESMAAQQQVESSREFLLAITDNMTEGMIATDAKGDITFVNAAASRLVDRDSAELLTMSASMLFKLHDPSSHQEAEESSEFGSIEDPFHVDVAMVQRRDGSLVPVALTASPIRAPGLEGSVIVFEDVSARIGEQLKIDRELEKLSWVGRIRDALDGERLELFAQPVIDLSNGGVIKHELLVRMRDGDGRLIEPANFIPTAEEYGLITEIDRWVLDESVRLAGLGHRVAFNLSARSVTDPHMLTRLSNAVRTAGVRPDLLECEITETAFVRDVDSAEDFVRGLRSLGCSVALDDFGVGYGGFAYLKRLPVSVLKIDREFVRDLCEETSSQHVVAAVVNLAKAFGMKTTAEGPESEMTLDLLRELGVDYAQGYVIGRPAPLRTVFPDL